MADFLESCFLVVAFLSVCVSLVSTWQCDQCVPLCFWPQTTEGPLFTPRGSSCRRRRSLDWLSQLPMQRGMYDWAETQTISDPGATDGWAAREHFDASCKCTSKAKDLCHTSCTSLNLDSTVFSFNIHSYVCVYREKNVQKIRFFS